MACENFSLKDLIKKESIVNFYWNNKKNPNIAKKLLKYIEDNTGYKWADEELPTNNTHYFKSICDCSNLTLYGNELKLYYNNFKDIDAFKSYYEGEQHFYSSNIYKEYEIKSEEDIL